MRLAHALSAVILVVACGGSTTTAPFDAATDATDAADGEVAASDCAKCVASNCALEQSACATDDACQKRVACMGGCTAPEAGDPATCQAKCGTDFPSAAADAYVKCIVDRCKFTCVTRT